MTGSPLLGYARGVPGALIQPHNRMLRYRQALSDLQGGRFALNQSPQRLPETRTRPPRNNARAAGNHACASGELASAATDRERRGSLFVRRRENLSRLPRECIHRMRPERSPLPEAIAPGSSGKAAEAGDNGEACEQPRQYCRRSFIRGDHRSRGPGRSANGPGENGMHPESSCNRCGNCGRRRRRSRRALRAAQSA
jgi:hypothetical protein